MFLVYHNLQFTNYQSTFILWMLCLQCLKLRDCCSVEIQVHKRRIYDDTINICLFPPSSDSNINLPPQTSHIHTLYYSQFVHLCPNWLVLFVCVCKRLFLSDVIGGKNICSGLKTLCLDISSSFEFFSVVHSFIIFLFPPFLNKSKMVLEILMVTSSILISFNYFRFNA